MKGQVIRMKLSKNYQFWFVTGSQHLYGEETLKQVKEDSVKIVEGLNQKGNFEFELVYKALLTTPEEITQIMKEASADDSCAGIVGWCHTFSPAKMWIKGLTALTKPFLHLHTQYNRDIPWSAIDMDFMNLNQAAHGDREFGFINARLRMPRKVVVGYWEEASVVTQINDWLHVAVAIAESKNLKIARFGDNMRQVAVTEGDKVEAEIKFGWAINGYAMGDIVEYVDAVTDAEVEALYAEYEKEYNILETSQEGIDSIKYQARIEIGFEKFLVEGGFGAFTTTFENLYGLKQLPGLAVQRLMAKGYGFGGEGDWKTAALVRLMKIMGNHKGRGTSFMEDYTYHMEPGNELVLGAHMLEVCPTIAEDKPSIVVKHLGIGGKEAPARFIFSSKVGQALNASLVDMGGRHRLIINEVQAVAAPFEMPNLPVAKAIWKVEPSLQVGAQCWILAGGAHHTAYSYDVSTQDLLDFAEFMGIEAVVIDKDTETLAFRQLLKLNDLTYYLSAK